MAGPTEKQFSDLIAEQKATTRALMSGEEKAANNAEAVKAGAGAESSGDDESRSLLGEIAGGITSIFKGSKGSASSEKEKADEEAAGDQKGRSLLGKIASGVTGMFDKMTEPVAAAKKGILALLKGTLVAGVLMAVVAFLDSDMWKKMKVIIVEKAAPLLKKFVKFLGDNWEEIAVFIGSILAAFVVFKAIMIGAKIVNTIKLIGIAFTAVKAFFASTMLPAVTGMMVPLLPFIAIAAAIGVVLYALWNAFEDFQTTLCETGSIGEALKVGIAKFMGTILGFIPAMILKLVGWVAGLFGFDDFKKKVDAIDPIQWISDTIKGLFDKLFAWFGLLFKDPVKALKNLVKGFFGGYLDIASWLVDMIKKPLVWLLGLFGWDDAAASVETFSLKGFVMETWDKVKCWVMGLFSWASEEDSGDSWLVKTVKAVITGVKEWFGKMFDFGTLKSSLASVINILTWLPNLVKDAVASVTSWLLGLFGFDDAAKAVSNASNWTIGGLIMGVVDSVVKWLKGIFSWGKKAGTDAAGDFSIWKMITGVFTSIKQWFDDTFKFDFAGLLDSLPEWIKDPKAAVMKMIKSMTKYLPSWLGGSESEADIKKEAEELAAEQKKKQDRLLDIRNKAAERRQKEIEKIREEKAQSQLWIDTKGEKGKARQNYVGSTVDPGDIEDEEKLVKKSDEKLLKLIAQNEKAKALDMEFKKKSTKPEAKPAEKATKPEAKPADKLSRPPETRKEILQRAGMMLKMGDKAGAIPLLRKAEAMFIEDLDRRRAEAERVETMKESALQKSAGSQNSGGMNVVNAPQTINANKTGVQNIGTPLKNTNLAGTLAAA